MYRIERYIPDEPMAFEDDLLDLLENKIKEQVEFQVVDHEVKLFGYCKNCKQ